MKALVLAAGRGRRLWPFTAERPKCLVPIGAGSILEHQLANLERVGIGQVVLVCGFGVEYVRRTAAVHAGDLRVKILYNPFYAVADNLISLWAARDEMDGDFVLLNGDNVFHPGILEALLAIERPCCLMVQHKSCYDDDDMKVQLQGEYIRSVGKFLPAELIQATSTGIMRFGGEGVEQLRRSLEEVVLEERALKVWFLAVIQRLIDRGFPVSHRDIGPLAWADVDTPEDLHFVRQHLHLFRDQMHLYPQMRGSA